CAIVLFQPPLCELVVAVDAVVDGGKEGVGGVGRAGHGIVALALGDVGLGGQPVELSQVVGQGHVGADAAGLARSVHMDAGHGAGGVKADDDVDHAAVVAALGGLDGDGAIGGADGAGDAGGGVVGNFLQLGCIRDGGQHLHIGHQGGGPLVGLDDGRRDRVD